MRPAVPRLLLRMAHKTRTAMMFSTIDYVYHDIDADGIIAGVLLESWFEEKGIEASFAGVYRDSLSFQGGTAAVLDIGFDDQLASSADESRTRIFYVDHHQPHKLPRDVIILDPWFLPRLFLPPHRYNTGLLAWLLAERRKDLEWKAALSNYADSSVDIHTRAWVSRYIQEFGVAFRSASRFLNFALFFEDVTPDFLRELVKEAQTPADIVQNELLLKKKALFERAFEEKVVLIREEAQKKDFVYIVFPDEKIKVAGKSSHAGFV